MKLVLYYAPITCALAPYITLTEAGAEFEVRPVNMRKGENRTPDYLSLNPKHQVPVLVIDGLPLTENVAMQQGIARTYPTAKLLPADPMQELQAISLMSFCAVGHPSAFLARINAPARVWRRSRARKARWSRRRQNSSTRNTASSTRCWRAAPISSTTSRRPTRISSGASGAARNSISILPSSRTARAGISSGMKTRPERKETARLRSGGADRDSPRWRERPL